MSGPVRSGRLVTRTLQAAARSSTPFRHAFTLIPRPALSKRIIQTPSLTRCLSRLPRLQQQAYAEQQDNAETPQEFTTFQELGDNGVIIPKVIGTIVNQMKIHTMTDVQRLTLNECLDGTDVIAEARTGTGKTLAFLLPIVQRILKSATNLERPSRSRASVDGTRALIISPTRELAEQIATEARKVTAGTAIQVQTAVGGSSKRYDLQQMHRNGCHILIGTPGRLKDVLSDSSSGVTLDNLDTFVLDEADRLLDIGFLPEIQEIQSFMPPRSERERQTLMFSATIPKEVVSLVRQTLRPDFRFVRTVDPDEAPTHERIPQKVVHLPGLQNQLPACLEIINNAIEMHKRDPVNNMPLKALIFMSSNNDVHLGAEIFGNMREPNSSENSRALFSRHPLGDVAVLEMHSKLTQAQRTSHSQQFRRAESAVMFTSDVSARGMDFPNVSHVIQIGLPRSADDYVHRLGRTGRAGKGGEGWLLIQEDERHGFRRNLGQQVGASIATDSSLQTARLDMTKGAQLPAETARLMQLIESGVRSTSSRTKSDAYRSMLGPLSQMGRDKQKMVDLMNDLARYGWGMASPPTLDRALVSRLGLGGLDGIVVGESNFGDRGRGGGRGGDRFGGDRSGSRGRGRGDDFNPRDPFGQGTGGRSNSAPPRNNAFGDRSGGFGDRNGRGSSFGGRGGRGGGGGGFGDRDRGGSRGGNRGFDRGGM